ncbi:MAG: hypothetical protein A4E49_00465 [Methanosaeta sp. PtaU1.Bin112]|nr:MAG: hypothetical protein A4E49_00465 [Methanosaeta sp. PtaU1.Bin112]
MPKDTRDKVTLSPEAYKALEVEAMLHGTSLKDTASKLILKAACPKCIEILDIMARPPKGTREEEPKGPMAQEPDAITAKGPDVTSTKEPKGERAQGPKVPKAKGKKLSEDTLALAKLKELYRRDPKPSLATMGAEVGYSKSTISDNLRKMKERGELE